MIAQDMVAAFLSAKNRVLNRGAESVWLNEHALWVSLKLYRSGRPLISYCYIWTDDE